MSARDKYIFIFTDKILDIIYSQDELSTSDLQGIISALVEKMFTLAKNWEE